MKCTTLLARGSVHYGKNEKKVYVTLHALHTVLE